MSDLTYNLGDLFETVVDRTPDRLALVAGPVRQTYRELDERSNRIANHLLSLGLEPHQHVGILSKNRAEWVEAMIGCYKARVVPINLNFRYVAPELRYVIDNADLVALIYEVGYSELVADSLALPPDDGDAGGGAGTAAPPALIVLDEPGARSPGSGADPLAPLHPVPYEKALETASADRPPGPRSSDDRYVLFTGGTTGMPKGVVWRHEDIYFAAMGGSGFGLPPIEHPVQVAERVNTDDAARLVMFVAGPLMHGNAQWAMWNALLMGGTVVLYTEPSYQPAVVWDLVVRERIVSMALVGDAMARPLVDHYAAAPAGSIDASSLFIVASGGAMLTAAVKEELARHLPNVIVMDRFGSSESGAQGVVGDGESGPRFTMGAGTSVLDEEMRPLTPGDGRTGKLARTGWIPLGYYKDEEKTRATFPVDPEGRRWSIPGDLATIEADGTIVVHGRGSSSINTGGEKVFPEEVEAAVKQHPAVFDAIVVGLPDERFGQRIAVALQMRDGAEIELEELQDHCRKHIAGYKVPREIIVIDRIPLTAAGKPDAAAARAMFDR